MKSPLIYIPTPETFAGIELPKVGLRGFVSWKLMREGRVVRESPPQPNKLTTALMDHLATNTMISALSYGACGTGSSAPAASDTNLNAEVSPGRIGYHTHAYSFTAVGGGVTEDYTQLQLKFLFNETRANGNLTEFGLFTSATSGAGLMACRHLFRDVLGTPTTIVKTNQEQLEVTYQIRAYPPAADAVVNNFMLTTEGTLHTLTTRANNINNLGAAWAFVLWNGPCFNDWVGIAASDALGTREGGAGFDMELNSVFSAYTTGNSYREEVATAEPAQANYSGGIGRILTCYTSPGYLYQTSVSPKINKTAIKKLIITLRRTWGEKP